jgi:uncharacterized phage-associated protein
VTDPLNAARYFIVRAYEDGKDAEMTNMKLQKLLYYTQSLYLALYNEPLFEEEIQAWRYGPVCPPAYCYYSQYEGNQLPIPSDSNFSDISSDIKDLFEEVWSYFGVHNAYLLSDMTHDEIPWKSARGDLPREAHSQQPLELSQMQKLGNTKLSEIESKNPIYEPVMVSVLNSALSSKSSNYVEKEDIRGWLESLLD